MGREDGEERGRAVSPAGFATRGRADLALIVEISDSSLAENRKLAGLYGRAGVPVDWIVNIVDRRVEAHSGPGPDGYSSRKTLGLDGLVPVAIEGTIAGTIAVADLLPPR